MIWCPCGHERLMHDSWGCKHRDGCGVSIIYLTPAPSAKPVNHDHEAAAELIKHGNALAIEADKLEESRLKKVYERSRREQDSSEVYPPPGLV